MKPQIYFALAKGLYKEPAHSRQRGVFSFERNGPDREQSAFPRKAAGLVDSLQAGTERS